MPQSTANEAAATSQRTARRALGLLAELTKARLSTLVVFTTAVGFVLAGHGGTDWVRLLWTVAGTALAAAATDGMQGEVTFIAPNKESPSATAAIKS